MKHTDIDDELFKFTKWYQYFHLFFSLSFSGFCPLLVESCELLYTNRIILSLLNFHKYHINVVEKLSTKSCGHHFKFS